MFEKVLVANRGEIAIRVLTACQEMGIKTVAVYSDVDANSLHVRFADEAYCLGDPTPTESYLNIEKIITAAKKTGAEAIHPGYGFLAENSLFSKRCEKEGIVFIGPRSRVIRLMGDKIKAKRTIEKAGVPVIPGYHGADTSTGTLIEEGLKLGFPLLIKAVLGGGGKGMRIVRGEDELESSIESCKRESLSAFGDSSLFLEKYLDRPRHIEFQILGDQHDRIIHLFERECSIQRRHQKIIEETPSCALTPLLREKMGEAALRVAEAVGYTNAGTVEFMMDENKNFYFLEMNTRLQVEHPITEAVTGVDLVKWQFRVAQGEHLTLKHGNLHQIGHAIECRIYAEDPTREFLPSTGRLYEVDLPGGINVRNDSGIETGLEVTPYYDPLLSKLTVHSENRKESIEKMVWALSKYVILGVRTNVSFLKRILLNKSFKSGEITTHFIEEHSKELFSKSQIPDEALIAVALAETINEPQAQVPKVSAENDPYSPWKTAGNWRNIPK